jgi:hypothetical protein
MGSLRDVVVRRSWGAQTEKDGVPVSSLSTGETVIPVVIVTTLRFFFRPIPLRKAASSHAFLPGIECADVLVLTGGMRGGVPPGLEDGFA